MSKQPKQPNAFAKVCHLAGQAVKRHDMIAAGDRVVVGVSGGKDSMVLMHALDRLRRRSPVPFELIPVTVDMGFDSFNPEPLLAHCRRRGWELRVDRIPGVRLLREKDALDRPCSLCSRLRRGRLHAVADAEGAGTIALGQHLDDLCVSLLLSLFRGAGLKTMGAHVAADQGSKRLIRPLCHVPERLIIRAADALALPRVAHCDFADRLEEDGDRAHLMRLLEQLDKRFSGVRHAMLHSMQDVRVAHLLDLRYLESLRPPPEEASPETEDGP